MTASDSFTKLKEQVEKADRRVNEAGTSRVGVTCPECEAKFDVEVNGSGGT